MRAYLHYINTSAYHTFIEVKGCPIFQDEYTKKKLEFDFS